MTVMARSDAAAGLPHDARGAVDVAALDQALDLLAEGLPRRRSGVLSRRPLAELLRDLDALGCAPPRAVPPVNGHPVVAREEIRARGLDEVEVAIEAPETHDVDVVFEPPPEVTVTPGAGVVFELSPEARGDAPALEPPPPLTYDVAAVFEPPPSAELEVAGAPDPAEATGPLALVEPDDAPGAQTDPGDLARFAPIAPVDLAPLEPARSEPPLITLEPVPVESLGPLPPLSEPPPPDDGAAPALSFDGDQTAMVAPAWLSALQGLGPAPLAPAPLTSRPPAAEAAPSEAPVDVERAAAVDVFARYSDLPLDPPEPFAARDDRPPLDADDATSLALDLDLGPLAAPTLFPTEPLPQEEFVAPAPPLPPSMPPLPTRSMSAPSSPPPLGPPPLPGFRADRKPTMQMPSLRAPSLRVPPAVPSRRASVAATPSLRDEELEAIELDLNEVEEVSPPPLPGSKK